MRFAKTLLAAVAAAALLASCASTQQPMSGPMSFFVTSTGTGQGGNLGGLAGADAHCQKLATAAGHGGKAWRAYLSVAPVPAAAPAPWTPGVNARDRIGKGPWFNAKGAMIARDVEHLHNGNNITKETALDERGLLVRGRGDTPNEHDILTGTRADGTAFAPQTDTTCKGWTSSTDGSAIVGHHDRVGPTSEMWAKSWVFSHQTAGCTPQALVSTGGSGKFYCFAAN
jgi:hypothetical protein